MAEREDKKLNILVFDTETANLEKPFCYNVGYVIYNTDEQKIVLARDYVVEQVRLAVVDVPGVVSVRVDLVWEPEWDRSRMSEEALVELGLDMD